HRRAADRLTLLRLRLARGMSALAEGEGTSTVHERWVQEVYPALGRATQELRVRRRLLEQQADAAERAGGRRMGGYQGAGFLGRGDRAREQIRQVVDFRGHQLGASIGGWPLAAAEASP